MRSISLVFFVVIFTTNFPVFSKDSARFSIGGGIFNYMEDGTEPHKDQSNMINLEIHSGRKMFNLIKPFVGFLGTECQCLLCIWWFWN